MNFKSFGGTNKLVFSLKIQGRSKVKTKLYNTAKLKSLSVLSKIEHRCEIRVVHTTKKHLLITSLHMIQNALFLAIAMAETHM